jgi:signal transduction histidine kinase
MNEATSADELRGELEELRASRARVVAAGDDERRRIERALHDGVQQDLVGIAVNLQLARELTESDPAAARSLIDEIAHDVHGALEGVRLLGRSIYPPLLLDLGIAEALRGAAVEIGVPARVDAPGGRYPPHVEATVYYCCLEALRDAERRGAGTRMTLRVWSEAQSLVFEAAIDQVEASSPAAPSPTMRDRLGSVGGHLDISSDGGCTRMVGTIPIAG